MSLSNSQFTNQTKSSTGLLKRFSQRIISSLPTRRPAKSDYEKSGTYESDLKENNNLQGTKKSRSPLITSNSFHKALVAKGEAKKAPSMIPRSKSRKRAESEHFKFEKASKGNGLNERPKSRDDTLHRERSFRDDMSVEFNPGEEHKKNAIMVELIVSTSQKQLEESIGRESASLSLKSCQDFDLDEAGSKVSDLSYKDAEEELQEEDKYGLYKAQENEIPRIPIMDKALKQEDIEMRRQERIIKNLYETIKYATGPLFDNAKWSWSGGKKENSVKDQNENYHEKSLSGFANVQQYYDYTMEEISDIWKDAVSLINSVRDHTLKFVEDKSKTIDKEQLILEAEMLQLAIDFAINYSKVKTDFLVKSLRKHLEVNESEKSNLEKFMESKSVAALYNDDDLDSMAQTVRELNTSVLKNEDPELEFK